MGITLEQAAQLLAKRGDLSAWQVTETRSRSAQRYTVFRRDEAVREVDTSRLAVTVHVLHDHGGNSVLGESSVVLGPGATPGDFVTEVDQARERALLVHNQPYELPAPSAAPAPVHTVDERVVEDARGVVNEVTDSIRAAAAAHPDVELSSSEVFASYSRARLLNSRGLAATRADTDVLVEYVLLAKDAAGEEHEIWHSPHERLLPDLGAREHLDRSVGYSRDRLAAQLPESGTFDVVFGEEALDTLWQFFTSQADASARFEGWSRLELDKPVIDSPRGDLLTLVSDPTLPGGMHSAEVDAQGLPCRRVTVIQDNVFKCWLATKKYADLTGVPATGPLGNVVVNTGPTPEYALLHRDRPVYQLLRFSAFEPSPTSGAFSGEIRTGYLHRDGVTTPVRGGSVSGNILHAFQLARFSAEATRRQAYVGPRSVFLGGLTITGR